MTTRRPAFTLMEMLLTVGIMGGAAMFMVPFYRDYQIRNELEIARAQISQNLQRVQLLAQSRTQSWSWTYDASEGVLFRGDDRAYDPSTVEVYPIPSSVQVTGLTRVTYDWRGKPSATGTILLTAINGDTQSVSVSIVIGALTVTTSADERLTICHRPGGSNPQTMEIVDAAWPGHENHGDTLGPCPASSSSSAASSSSSSSAAGFVRTVTLLSSKVAGGADLADFPALISVTDAALRSVGNGGHVQQSDGGDIAFRSSGGAQLMHQIEKYDPAAGQLTAWVKIPTLSASANTVIEMTYGTAGLPDQWNPTAVWTSGFKGVYHLIESPTGGAPQMKDATSYGTHLSVSGTIPAGAQGAGKIAGSLAFSGSNQYLQADPADQTGNFTFSAWVKPDTTTLIEGTPVFDSKNTSSNHTFIVAVGGSSKGCASKYRFRGANASEVYVSVCFGAYSDANWHLLAVTWDEATVRTYQDGAAQNTGTFSGSFNGLIARYRPAYHSGNAEAEWKGRLDEVRIANVARTAGWLTTEFNNQNAPSTFFTLGAEQ